MIGCVSQGNLHFWTWWDVQSSVLRESLKILVWQSGGEIKSIERQAGETSSEERKIVRRKESKRVEGVKLGNVVTFAVSMGIISDKKRSGSTFVLP